MILKMIEERERYLEDRIEYLEAEVQHWKDEHFKLLTSSIQHGEHMMGQLLIGALNGAFTPKKDEQ